MASSWASVGDSGLTLSQRWFNVLVFAGDASAGAILADKHNTDEYSWS